MVKWLGEWEGMLKLGIGKYREWGGGCMGGGSEWGEGSGGMS